MKTYLTSISNFFDWWFKTLFSCIPPTWASYFNKVNKKIDLVIVHQGNTVFIQTEDGHIIDSASVLAENSEKEVLSDSKVLDPGAKLNKFPDEGNVIALDQNAAHKINSEPVDFELGDQLVGLKGDDVDFDLSDQTVVVEKDARGNHVDEMTGILNLDPVHITEGDDTTIFFDSDDKTTRLLEIHDDRDEDTIIIQNDQGKLININSDDSNSNESTLLFRNEGGKIRQVKSSVVQEDIDEIVVDNVHTELVHEDEKGSQGCEIVARLLSLYQGNKKCLYLLPDEKVFTIKLSYPIQAMQNIENVLRFDLEKHIPLNLKEIRYFYALNLQPAEQKVDVEVAVIKSLEFDTLNTILAPYIDQGLLCTTKGFFEKFGRKINFVEKVAEKSWYSIFNKSNIHLAFNSALFLTLLFIPYFLYQLYNEKLLVSSPQEIEKAQNIISSLNLINTQTKLGAELADQISNVPRLIYILSNLSENIDQQAWLSRFSFKNNEIRIKGEAVSATAVSDQLSDTGLFESIKFISSIIKNPRNGKETFELLLRVKTGE